MIPGAQNSHPRFSGTMLGGESMGQDVRALLIVDELVNTTYSFHCVTKTG